MKLVRESKTGRYKMYIEKCSDGNHYRICSHGWRDFDGIPDTYDDFFIRITPTEYIEVNKPIESFEEKKNNWDLSVWAADFFEKRFAEW